MAFGFGNGDKDGNKGQNKNWNKAQGKNQSKNQGAGFGASRWDLRGQVFTIDDLYGYVQAYAEREHAAQTAAALPYARARHEGQFRKGPIHIPYIYHPLLVACHALAMQLTEDDLIAALLLHDVCEDCVDEQGNPIPPENLPVGPVAQEAVRLVTKPDWQDQHGDWEDVYYRNISHNRLAILVKLLDRCNNVSMMASGFTHNKMARYITETEHYIVPFLDILQASDEASDRRAAFLLRYQLISDLENAKRLLG